MNRYEAFYEQLREIISSEKPDAKKFRSALDEALAAGFPVDFTGGGGYALLYISANWLRSVRAGLPQILIAAGADVNFLCPSKWTPLTLICLGYVKYGDPEYLAAAAALLAAGARPELDRGWIEGECTAPDQLARRSQLQVYLDSWISRDRAGDPGPAPAFDYAL